MTSLVVHHGGNTAPPKPRKRVGSRSSARGVRRVSENDRIRLYAIVRRERCQSW